MEIESLPPWLTVEEVGKVTRKSDRSVLRGIRRKAIPAVLVGGTYRVPRSYLESLARRAMAGFETSAAPAPEKTR